MVEFCCSLVVPVLTLVPDHSVVVIYSCCCAVFAIQISRGNIGGILILVRFHWFTDWYGRIGTNCFLLDHNTIVSSILVYVSEIQVAIYQDQHRYERLQEDLFSNSVSKAGIYMPLISPIFKTQKEKSFQLQNLSSSTMINGRRNDTSMAVKETVPLPNSSNTYWID